MRRGFLNKNKAFTDKKSKGPDSKEVHTVQRPRKLSFSHIEEEDGHPERHAQLIELPFDTDHPDDQLLYTQIPSQLLSTKYSDVPGGWTECFMYGAAKRSIYNTPGFPQDLVQPPKSVYRIGQTSMGLGMFATEDLAIGDHIMSERPLIILPVGITVWSDPVIFARLTTTQKREREYREWEKMLKVVFDRLEPENQEAYMALANSHAKDGSGPILGISRTNGFQIQNLAGSEYAGVCKTMSRINHSCRPSADRLFDIPSFSFQLRVTRPIKKGDQIYVSYCDILENATSRQAYLASYGIVCRCKSCIPDTTESDKRRLQLRESIRVIEEDFENWLADPLLADDYTIRTSLAWLDVVRVEGVEASDAYRHHMYAIIRAYTALGDLDNTMKYGRLLGLWYRAQSGNDDTLNKMIDPDFHRGRAFWRARVCPDHV